MGLRHPRQNLRRATGEILFTYSAKVGLDELLAQRVALAPFTADASCGGYLLDQGDSRGGNTSQ